MEKRVNGRYYNVSNNLNDSTNVYTGSLKYLHIQMQERDVKTFYMGV